MMNAFDCRVFLYGFAQFPFCTSQSHARMICHGQHLEMFKMINLIEPADLSTMAAVPISEPAMETIAAADAKTNFGALLDKAQRGPVTISKNGRAVAVIMSAEAYREEQELKLEVLRREIQKGLDSMKRGKLVTPERAFAAFRKELKKK
jgi:prevent-host-death family protein